MAYTRLSCLPSCTALQARGAGALGVPVIATEQYPKALGSTVDEVKTVLPKDTPVIAKTLFSMLTPEVEQWLGDRPSVKQVQNAHTHAHLVERTHAQHRHRAASRACNASRARSCRRMQLQTTGACHIQHLSSMSMPWQVMLVGIEAHVCILQTTLDLLQRGYEVRPQPVQPVQRCWAERRSSAYCVADQSTSSLSLRGSLASPAGLWAGTVLPNAMHT